MTTTPLSLALRIAQLIEDYSETEISEAILLLEKHGCRSELLAYVGHRKIKRAIAKTKRSERPPRNVEDTNSLTVLNLLESDPDKFRLLSEFDQMVRRGQVLAKHEDMKRFGKRISKDFQPGKSRKATIEVLLRTLAERPLPEIEELMEFVVTFGVAGDTDEYQRLAQFLIKGRPTED